MAILIFKTNIRFKKDLKKVEPVLNSIDTITKWNIDQKDIDKILRIESITDEQDEIIKSLQQEGYFCEELED
ncbi:MAG: hypothetical protein QM764_23450 [Chitinophagaceae bacterium]